MQLVDKPISMAKLKKLAKSRFGNFVKAVVDIEKNVMVIDAELHSDEEAHLLEKGATQKNLWGINLYPFEKSSNFIEFDSMINVRPSQANPDRGVCDPEIRQRIAQIIEKLIKK